MGKQSRFRISKTARPIPADPESLFRDIKQRSPRIQYLWSHQADILRTWHQKYRNSKDVAIELPTGTGKTLIGLLIAEYRRQAIGERGLYLCPTRQLAHQVGSLAKDYGIKAYVLVGDQKKYPPADFGAYATGNAITITTYSSVFNNKPRLKDANCLILDDAHSAEDYIASMWTMTVDRYDQKDVYSAILDIFKGTLRDEFIRQLEAEQPPVTRRAVDKIPFPIYLQRLPRLKELLGATSHDSIRYAWDLSHEHMEACNMFISWSSICVRPIIPPTLTHPPFAAANHRVYMSATLGSGGELERITGVLAIQRIPVPEGWDQQGTGRRFFIVPGYALDESGVEKVLWQSVGSVSRSLILCPDKATARRVESDLKKSGVKRDVLSAQDIEDSLVGFTSRTGAVLILSGRYDGLDLEGKACRLLVVHGLPSGHNAQEQFLLGRIGATSLLRDRIRTRLTQAFGRCTRGPTDYAAVILVGAPLVDFCLQREVKSTLHPELQAELEYGLQMSAASTPSDWSVLLNAFLAQDEDWKDGDDWIRRFRDGVTRTGDSAEKILLLVASDEVSYLYNLWKGDYEAALAKARSISDALTGDEVAGYRAWWYYLTGSVAWLMAQTTGSATYAGVAQDFFRRAATCPTAVSWFAALARMRMMTGLVSEMDELLSWSVENIEELLTQLGLHGPKFEKTASELIGLIDRDESTPFSRGLEQLGRFLGFFAWRPGVQGAPDCVWTLADRLCIVLEAKSEESAGDSIPIRDAREAKGHLDWVSANVKLADNAEVVVLLVSPRSVIAVEALPHTEGVYRLGVDEIRSLARKAAGSLRAARAQSAEGATDALRTNIQQELVSEQLSPRSLLEQLKMVPLKSLPQA
jgi:hypothetical protein